MAKQQEGNGDGHGHPRKVEVTVDGRERKVDAGTYLVSDFKKEVHVDASKELIIVEGGSDETPEG